jgi:tyrosinase
LGRRYWDWSLDSDNLSKSPIFQSSPGLGGDSHPSTSPSKVAIVGGDRCLKDGPFSDVVVHFWSQKGEPHCLSRGFEDVVPISQLSHSFRPEAIEELLQQPDYEKFFLSMEHGPHNWLQQAIGGDMFYNTAPYG